VERCSPTALVVAARVVRVEARHTGIAEVATQVIDTEGTAQLRNGVGQCIGPYVSEGVAEEPIGEVRIGAIEDWHWRRRKVEWVALRPRRLEEGDRRDVEAFKRRQLRGVLGEATDIEPPHDESDGKRHERTRRFLPQVVVQGWPFGTPGTIGRSGRLG